MYHRIRFGITAVFFCHLLLATKLVTSQLLPSSATSEIDAQTTSRTEEGLSQATSSAAGEQVTIRAREQEKDGPVYKLHGDVEIAFRRLTLRGDEITYDSATGQVTATGHLTLDGGPHDEHIEASHGSYNTRSETGEFFDVVGTTGVRVRGPHVTLTSSTPFTFTGKKVEKTSSERYVVYHGSVTACELPRPRWTFNGEKITVEVGGKARIYNSTFRVETVPVFYFPFAQHPVEQLGRNTGFLVPTFGTSSKKGRILGDAFYWAINRSTDATIGAEYYSKRGWAQHGEFRWRPAENAYLRAHYFGVLDRGVGPAEEDQGGQDFNVDAEAYLPWGIRGVVSAEYLSSFVFRLAFSETFSQVVNSEVKSNVFFSRTVKGFSLNTLFGRYQNFQSIQPGQVVTILHTPSLEAFSVDRAIGRSPIYWGFDTAAEGVSRKQPGFVTGNLVSRFDLHPRISLPRFTHGWTFRPEMAARETYYGERLIPNGGIGVPADQDVNRRALEASVEIRPPARGRIFERQFRGRKIKHVLEPRIVYHYVAGVNNFPNIIRFDSRDILSDTNDVEYGVVQRIYAKNARQLSCDSAARGIGSEQSKGQPLSGTNSRTRVAPAASAAKPTCGAPAHELFSWELKNRYFFDPNFGGALVPGVRNVFTATDLFTGIAFLTAPRHFAPIVSRVRVHPALNTDVDWEIDYDSDRGRMNASTIFVNYRLGDIFAGAGHTYLLTPGEIVGATSQTVPTPEKFNQFRLLLGYGNLNKRGINGAAQAGFDANLNFLQYSAVQASYNWDCCGISVEYRRYALGSVRNENQYRFAFTLANIGTFGNLKRQERIY